MLFDGKCKGIRRLAVGEPGVLFGDGGTYLGKGFDLNGWSVSGVLADFTDTLDKSFLDEIDDDEEFDSNEMFELMCQIEADVEEEMAGMDEDGLREELEKMLEDEECNAENHFGLARGAKFMVAIAAPGVKVTPRIDGTFEVLPSVYGREPDEIRVHPIASESGLVGVCVDGDRVDEKDALQWWVDDGYASLTLFDQPDSGLRKVLPSMGHYGIVYEGIYHGQVRFLVFSGMVLDYDIRVQEKVFQYLTDTLKVEVCSKMVFDELSLVEQKLKLFYGSDWLEEENLDRVIEDAREQSDNESKTRDMDNGRDMIG